jgi:hypothetical protein
MLEWLAVDRKDKLTESLRAIDYVEGNTSWFRDTPHYWAEGSLPLAYAVMCVEVISKVSGEAGCSSG